MYKCRVSSIRMCPFHFSKPRISRAIMSIKSIYWILRTRMTRDDPFMLGEHVQRCVERLDLSILLKSDTCRSYHHHHHQNRVDDSSGAESSYRSHRRHEESPPIPYEVNLIERFQRLVPRYFQVTKDQMQKRSSFRTWTGCKGDSAFLLRIWCL